MRPGGRHQPHDRQRGHALAAAGLADDGQRAAGLDREADAVDGRRTRRRRCGKVVRRSRTSSRAVIQPRRPPGVGVEALDARPRSRRGRVHPPGRAGRPGRRRRAGSARRLTSYRRCSSAIGSAWSSTRRSRSGWSSSPWMRSAADCLPRLSPPAASPAAIAAISRSASGRPALATKASAVACEHLRPGQHVAGDAEIVACRCGRTSRRRPRRCAPRRARGGRARAAGAARARRRRRSAPPPPAAGARPCASSASAGAGRTAGSSAPAWRSAPTPRRLCTHKRADREEAAGDGDAEAAVGVAREDRPGHLLCPVARPQAEAISASSMIATAHVQPAAAPQISCGKKRRSRRPAAPRGCAASRCGCSRCRVRPCALPR